MKLSRLAALFVLAGAAHAQYGFSTPPVIVTENCDGTAVFTGDALAILGCNNGTDAPGLISVTYQADLEGILSFNYAFGSLDLPGYDNAAYFVNDGLDELPVLIADTNGESGTVALSLTVGECFGFQVGSLFNLDGPAFLLVSDLSLTTPEPNTGLLVTLGLCALCTLATRKFKCQSQKKREASETKAWVPYDFGSGRSQGADAVFFS